MRSFPFSSISRGDVPVTFAIVLYPPARKPAAINLTTDDFPREPFT